MALRGSRIALLGAEDYTESNLNEAVRTLQDIGAEVELIGDRSPRICVLRHRSDGITEKVTLPAAHTLDQIKPADYDVVAIPATLWKDGALEADAATRDFLAAMQASGKMVLWLPVPDRATVSNSSAARSRRFSLWKLVELSWQNWNAINAPRLGAALAYYTLLSLAPLVVLSVTITSLLFRREIIQSGLIWQVEALMGSSAANLVRAVLEHARWVTGGLAGLLSIGVMLFGASGVVLELRDSLDTVWGVKPRYGTGVLSLIRERAFAFLLILGTGMAMLALFVLSAILDTPARILLGLFAGEAWVAQLITLGTAFFGTTFFFSVIYRVVPDTSIRWSDVWTGGLVTAALFTAGKLVIGLYLGKAGIGSPYAAAGSILVFLVWVYYSAQIFLFGAEFTHVYALRHGSLRKR